MPDTRDITQRIAGWLRADAVPHDDPAEAAARAYAAACRRASDRLDACAGLLAQGLRTEAVQEAGAQPPLLEEIAALELPDASEWVDVCRRRDWPVPDAIRPDVAGMLNRAYAEELSAEALMREYRLRCVVRAPIVARLAALRALAAAESDNQRWQEALGGLEAARLTEIRAALPSAAGKLEILESLHREVHDARLTSPPPADLVHRLDGLLQDSRLARAQQRLEAILPALEAGYSAMDAPACERLLAEWTETLRSVGRTTLQVPAPLRERVEPIAQWLDQEARARVARERFETACDHLAGLVRGGGAAATIQAALDEAMAHERPLPDRLAEEAREVLERRRRVERRKRTRTAAVLTLGVVLVLAGIGAWIVSQQNRRDVEQRLASIREAIDGEQLLLAETRLEDLGQAHPDRSAEAPVLAARGRLEDAFAARAADAAKFEGLMAGLETTDVEAWDPSTLEEAAALVREGAQEERLSRSRRVLEDHRAEQRRRANVAALEAIPGLRDELASVDGDRVGREPAAVADLAGEVRRRVEGWLDDDRIEEPAVSLLRALSQRAIALDAAAEAVLEQRRRTEAQADALDALALTAGRPAAMARLLRRFAERFPEVPLSPSFVEAADLLPAWEAVRAWREIRDTWPSVHPTSRVDAAERLQQIASHRDEFPESPLMPRIDAYASHWGAGLLASADEGPWRQRLPELMQAPAFRDLGVADTTDGRRFYVVGDADRRETSLGSSVRVALTPDLSQLTPIDFPGGVLGPVRLSPQAGMANQLLALLADFEFRTWDLFAIDVVQTVHQADEVDAVLRGVLLGLILDEYETEVGPLEAELAALRTELSIHADDTANWMDPEDLAAQRSREALREVFAKPIDFDGIRQTLVQRAVALGRNVSPPIVGHAVLLADDQGVPRLQLGTVPPPGPRDVFGVSSEQPPGWKRMGQRNTRGEVTWTDAAAGVPPGSQVWLLDPLHDRARFREAAR